MLPAPLPVIEADAGLAASGNAIEEHLEGCGERLASEQEALRTSIGATTSSSTRPCEKAPRASTSASRSASHVEAHNNASPAHLLARPTSAVTSDPTPGAKFHAVGPNCSTTASNQAELATRSRIHGSPGTTLALVGSASCEAGSACGALPVALLSDVQTTRNSHRRSTASATNAKSLWPKARRSCSRFPKNPAVATWSTRGIELRRAQHFSGTSLKPTSRNEPDGHWRA